MILKNSPDENVRDKDISNTNLWKPFFTYRCFVCLFVTVILICSFVYITHCNQKYKALKERNRLLDEKCTDITLKKQAKNTHGFPKIMHRIFGFWDNKIPEPWLQSLKSCMEKENGFKLMFWNKSMVVELISQHYPWFMPQFLSYKHEVQRADVARYFILFHYGGIYLDMDIKCKSNRTLKTFFKSITSGQNRGKDTVLLSAEPFGVTNLFLVSKQCSSFMKYIITMLEYANYWYILPYATVMFSTGPTFVSNCYGKYITEHQNDILILHKSDFRGPYFQDSGKHGTWHDWDAAIILHAYNFLIKKNYGLVILAIIFVLITLLICYKLCFSFIKNYTKTTKHRMTHSFLDLHYSKYIRECYFNLKEMISSAEKIAHIFLEDKLSVVHESLSHSAMCKYMTKQKHHFQKRKEKVNVI